jgi:hypothetical protein
MSRKTGCYNYVAHVLSGGRMKPDSSRGRVRDIPQQLRFRRTTGNKSAWTAKLPENAAIRLWRSA